MISSDESRALARELAQAVANGDQDSAERLLKFMANAPGAVDPDRIAKASGRLLLMADYRLNHSEDVPWLIHGLIYSAGVTLLSGPPKKGKTTLIGQLVRTRETGGDFLGRQITPGPTMLLSEESGYPLVYKFGQSDDLVVFDRAAAVSGGLSFDDALAVAAGWADGQPRSLVIIDTLAVWAGIEDENDASETTQAVSRITHLAETTGAAVLLVHHTRKGGGHDGEAIRGSSAILSTVGLSAELRTVSEASDDRNLYLSGRVILPETLSLTFDRETKLYAVQDRAAVRLSDIEAWAAVIPFDGDGLTRADCEGLWEVTKTVASTRLRDLIASGHIRAEKTKIGRTWGYLYWSTPASPTDAIFLRV